MKPAEIYRRAAERVSRARYESRCWFSCNAVDAVNRVKPFMGVFSPEREEYAELFSPREDDEVYVGDFDYEDDYYEIPRPREEARDLRILALCFMAAISEADNG